MAPFVADERRAGRGLFPLDISTAIEHFDEHRNDKGMKQDEAIAALGALAQETRLSVFRSLVQAGPEGMIAGEIAAAAGAAPSTMSHHLALLERAGLVRSRRDGRTIVYAADYDGTRGLLAFLMEDCCQGRPEICGGAAAASACEAKGGCP